MAVSRQARLNPLFEFFHPAVTDQAVSLRAQVDENSVRT
jgi:hypothetical protein